MERANGVFQKFSGSLGQGRCSGGTRLGSLPTRPPWPLLPLPSAMLPVPEAFQSLVTHFCVGETTVTGKHRAPFQHELQQPCCASLIPHSHRGPAGRVLTWVLRVPLRRPGLPLLALGAWVCIVPNAIGFRSAKKSSKDPGLGADLLGTSTHGDHSFKIKL